jgi:hypothetical protein
VHSAFFSRFRTAFDGRRSTQAWLQNLAPFQVFINTSVIQDKTLTIYIACVAGGIRGHERMGSLKYRLPKNDTF